MITEAEQNMSTHQPTELACREMRKCISPSVAPPLFIAPPPHPSLSLRHAHTHTYTLRVHSDCQKHNGKAMQKAVLGLACCYRVQAKDEMQTRKSSLKVWFNKHQGTAQWIILLSALAGHHSSSHFLLCLDDGKVNHKLAQCYKLCATKCSCARTHCFLPVFFLPKTPVLAHTCHVK